MGCCTTRALRPPTCSLMRFENAPYAIGIVSWLSSPWDEIAVFENLPDTDLLLCLGGDGTVLSAARSVLLRAVPFWA